MATNANLIGDINIAINAHFPRVLDLLSNAVVLLLPGSAAHGTSNLLPLLLLSLRPRVEALLVDVLATGGPAVDDCLAFLKIREADRAVALQGLAILVVGLTAAAVVDGRRVLEDLLELRGEKSELIDEVVARAQDSGHDLSITVRSLPSYFT